MAIYVKAYITESGDIKAELPKDHPVGEVTLVIEPSAALDENFRLPDADESSAGLVITRMMRTDIWHIYQRILRQYWSQDELAEAEVPLRDEEIEEMMKPSPKKLGEIVTELENAPKIFSPLIGFDDASQFSVSPDQIIEAMMHISIWDVYLDIVKECRDDLQPQDR